MSTQTCDSSTSPTLPDTLSQPSPRNPPRRPPHPPSGPQTSVSFSWLLSSVSNTKTYPTAPSLVLWTPACQSGLCLCKIAGIPRCGRAADVDEGVFRARSQQKVVAVIQRGERLFRLAEQGWKERREVERTRARLSPPLSGKLCHTVTIFTCIQSR